MKHRTLPTLGAVSALALFGIGTVGCERESSAERAAEDAGDAIEEVADDIEDATD